MFNKIICVILLLAGGAQAQETSKAGRADVKLTVETLKSEFPNRYLGTVRDMNDVRLACVDLQQTQSAHHRRASRVNAENLQIGVFNNQQLVNVLHRYKGQGTLLAILKDRRNRVDQALPGDLIVKSWVYGYFGVSYVKGKGFQIHEPQKLRANLVGVFDDLISAVRTENYSQCVSVIDDVVGSDVRI